MQLKHHIHRCSSLTAFAPLGQTYVVGWVHMQSPHGNTINNIHDYIGAKQSGVKKEIGLILMQDLP